MKRTLQNQLLSWRKSATRKPLILKGARQVGKSWLVREFGKEYDDYVEVNFEFNRAAASLFLKDRDPIRIVRDLSLLTGKDIRPGRTLLFLDEIQECPEAITALRYFYELLPELHVIAAGSLLDFTLDAIGLPVGRVELVYLYPLSFSEFLEAMGQGRLVKALSAHDGSEPLAEAIHEKLLTLLGEYMAVGGMPAAVNQWVERRDLRECMKIHRTLIETFRQDFGKYATKHQQKYIDIVFGAVPRLAGKKFVYTAVSPDVRSRELRPAFELLEKAGLVHTVGNTAGNGVPLGAEVDPPYFKAIFFDVALMQSLLGLEYGSWILDPATTFVNQGAVCESFAGQELLAYADPVKKGELFYWARDKRGSSAEVDYLLDVAGKVVPLEVKSGNSHIKSLRLFLKEKKGSPYGIVCSTRNFSRSESIHSVPLYALSICGR